LTLSRQKLEERYRSESDPKLKERLLLVLEVRGDGELPAHVSKQIHRSKPWASYWLDRYDKEGVASLQDRPRSGSPSKLPPEISVKIKKKLKESKQGWTTKQVNDMIVREGGVQYHYTHVCRLLHKWGFKQKVPRKVHVNTASPEEKKAFKKRRRKSWTT